MTNYRLANWVSDDGLQKTPVIFHERRKAMIIIEDTDTPLKALSKIIYSINEKGEYIFSRKDLKDIRDYLTIFLRNPVPQGESDDNN